MKTYTQTTEQMTELSNQVKENILAKLQDEGIIKDWRTLSATYIVIVAEQSFFGRAWSKVRKHADDSIGKDKALIIKVLKDTDPIRESNNDAE